MYISPEISARLKQIGIGMPPGHWGMDQDFKFEPPINLVHGGDMRHKGLMGAFSYSESRLSPYVQSVGRYCSIGSEVIIGGMEHPVDWISTSNIMYDRAYWTEFEAGFQPIMAHSGSRWMTTQNHNVIGHDVWIGGRAIIRTGVNISTGAIIGSGTMVVKDVPPYAIVTGNPGRVHRLRFSDNLVERILASEWWNYKYTDMGDFGFNNPEVFLDKFLSNKHRLVPYTPERRTIAEWIALVTDQPEETS